MKSEITIHYKGPIVTRKEAIERGEKKYFTGKPCKHGHISQRRYRGGCCECTRLRKPEQDRKYYLKNSDKIIKRSRKYALENIEKISAYHHKRWYQNHEENLSQLRERMRLNRPIYNKNRNKKHRENPEKERKKGRERYKKNSDIFKANSRNRKARIKNSQGKHTAKDIKEILFLQNYKCSYCKKSIKKKYHVDHIIPLSKGGSNDRKNLQCACPQCNMNKKAKDPIDWAQENGRLL